MSFPEPYERSWREDEDDLRHSDPSEEECEMTLRIVKSSEPVTVDQLVLCAYSAPGLGKTTLGFTAEAPLLIDFDRGVYRAAHRGDSVPVRDWKDVENITSADLAPYKTIVLDTAGRALDFLTSAIISANPKQGRGGSLTLQGFGELKARFSAYLKMLRTLGKDVVLFAHMDEQRNGDDVIERLDVAGGSKGEIYKSADAMGRIIMRASERLIDFNPRENSFGKNPCGLPVLPFAIDNKKCLADIIATIKSKLNAQAGEEKTERDAMQDLITAIAEVQDAGAFTLLLPDVRKGGARALSLANKRMHDLNLKWDKATDSIVPQVEHAGNIR